MRHPSAIALLVGAGIAGPALASPERPSELPKGQRPLLVIMNQVVDGLLPRILAGPSEVARRVTVPVQDGLVGVGPFTPPGGSDGGQKSPPRTLFPRAGLGNSLNVDPITGRNALTNTP
jgi:hypothetical protein